MSDGEKTEADRLLDLMFEVTQTFFRLRAAGRESGAVTGWGGGLWGFLHSLHQGGPQTVPQLARARPVARQRIQRLADEAVEEGYIRFVDNPRHKRSKLLELTPEGEAAYAAMTEDLRRKAAELAVDFDSEKVEEAAALLRRLRTRLSARD
jgi:DNA-binding MarR family transcriptional regulator